MKIYIFILIGIMIIISSCKRTPFKYRNDIQLKQDELEVKKDSLLSSLDRIHKNSDILSFFSKSKDRDLRVKFTDIFFDSSKQKVVFSFVDTVLIDFENVNLSRFSQDGNIYYPFIFKGVLNKENMWELEKIEGYNFVYAYSADRSEEHLRQFSYREMATFDWYGNGPIPYKYNIDDIRIFNGPLFEDSVSIHSDD